MPKTVKEVLFNCAKTAQEELDEFKEGSAIYNFAERNWRVCEGLITAAGLADEYDAFKGSQEKPWDDRQVAVILTNAEWSRLTSYILMSTAYRKGELEAWESLSTETEEDGSPKFPNAPRNIEFWTETNALIDRVREIIDKR